MRAASFFFAAAVFLASSVAIAQAPDRGVSLSLAEARVVARQALNSGNTPVADAISRALLQRDPDDAEMLLFRAVISQRQGDLDAAEDFARRAHGAAEAPNLRFDAAFIVADALARREAFTRSQLWLRRADQAAQNDRQRQLIENRYRAVTRANPLSVQLRFSARPSNNVNNGAESVVVDIGGLPFRLDDSGQQLGGYEASAGASLSYRVSENETQKTEVLGELFGRKTWLNSDAKEAAPDAEGSDFDYAVIIAGLRHQRLIWPDVGPSAFTGLAGQSWYGGQELARWGELRFDQSFARDDSSVYRLGLRVRTEDRQDDSINDSEALSVSVDYIQRTEDGGSFGFGATLKKVWSDAATVDQHSAAIRANRNFARIGAFEPRVRASIEGRIYDKFTSVVDGREDIAASLSISTSFPDVTYYGFSPEVSLQARRTWSNVDIYDRNELSLGLTAVSRF